MFEQTAAEVFTPKIATIVIERAHRIGDTLKSGLFLRPEITPEGR